MSKKRRAFARWMIRLGPTDYEGANWAAYLILQSLPRGHEKRIAVARLAKEWRKRKDGEA